MIMPLYACANFLNFMNMFTNNDKTTVVQYLKIH